MKGSLRAPAYTRRVNRRADADGRNKMSDRPLYSEISTRRRVLIVIVRKLIPHGSAAAELGRMKQINYVILEK